MVLVRATWSSGRRGGTAVELSAIAAGTGGFVIHGIDSGGQFLVVASSGAGDVNGDGLMDLIIGAKWASPRW